MKKLKLILMVAVLNVAALSCNSDDDNDSISCDDAILATAEAADAYNNATPDNYEDRCNAYKDALQDQIESCGDDSGFLQDLIDDLGDCTLNNVNGSITVNVASAPTTFDEVTVTTSGTTRHVHAESSLMTSMWIDFDVETGDTGADAVQNFTLHALNRDWTPMSDEDGGNWTSNISVNSATAIDGTFFGIVESPDAINQQDLTNGIINIDL
jgi:hypothetical protein